MKDHRAQFTVTAMCRQLGVSREGYYKWLKRDNRPSARSEKRSELDRIVKELFFKHKRRYGAPRIAKVMNQVGFTIDKKTVAASLKRQELRAKAHVNSKLQRIQSTIFQCMRIFYNRISLPPGLTKSMFKTLPTCTLNKDGCIWPLSLICTLAM